MTTRLHLCPRTLPDCLMHTPTWWFMSLLPSLFWLLPFTLHFCCWNVFLFKPLSIFIIQLGGSVRLSMSQTQVEFKCVFHPSICWIFFKARLVLTSLASAKSSTRKLKQQQCTTKAGFGLVRVAFWVLARSTTSKLEAPTTKNSCLYFLFVLLFQSWLDLHLHSSLSCGKFTFEFTCLSFSTYLAIILAQPRLTSVAFHCQNFLFFIRLAAEHIFV